MNTILKILGYSSLELHGDIPQAGRLKAFNAFKEKESTLLLATDVAARGIDIPDVQFVVNLEIPMEGNRFIHRVGRTARAGKEGSSFTICTKGELKVLKKMLKGTHINFDKTLIATTALAPIKNEISAMTDKIRKVHNEERAEKEFTKAEMEADKASNMLKYKEEILNRPKREWIISSEGKEQLRQNDLMRFPHISKAIAEKAEQEQAERDEKPRKRRKLK